MSRTDASPEPAPAAACPLCGGANGCAMAAAARDGGAGECWCFAARIAPEALARIPDGERGRRCVCARCAQG
ncbi:MAG TPA: cysteine-rich CWC family protein [Longimicrobiaceae bacterium]|nr:cysteine-rich CWC family protein [Longimicrobiaceae bacterium]